MNVVILNVDTDPSPITNGAAILKKMIPAAQVVDVVRGEGFSTTHPYDRIIITGSRASFADSLPWIASFADHLKKIREANIPCLGICFGMQMVAHTFHGEARQNQADEQGFLQINLTSQATEDLVFKGLPSSFKVYQAHHDIVVHAPPRARIFAQDTGGIQAFRWHNFVGVQFHPEITPLLAQAMAKRDHQDLNKIMNGVNQQYTLPQSLIKNFLAEASSI